MTSRFNNWCRQGAKRSLFLIEYRPRRTFWWPWKGPFCPGKGLYLRTCSKCPPLALTHAWSLFLKPTTALSIKSRERLSQIVCSTTLSSFNWVGYTLDFNWISTEIITSKHEINCNKIFALKIVKLRISLFWRHAARKC